jgi:SNF2 family DNA or RNA helicase
MLLLLLQSLKAAALGLNLTVANHVVLVDLWWNPTTEEQAIDRAHRIGQTRPVQVGDEVRSVQKHGSAL